MLLPASLRVGLATAVVAAALQVNHRIRTTFDPVILFEKLFRCHLLRWSPSFRVSDGEDALSGVHTQRFVLI